MAVESLTTLRKKAISAGMNKSEARKAERDELKDFLSSKNGKGSKKSAVKAVKKVAKKKSKVVAKKAKQTPAVKSGKGKAKRSAKNNGNGDVGRASIGKVDYTVEDDAWKPRSGSAVETIWKALKKSRDNVDRAYEILKPNMKSLVHTKKNDGSARTKDEMAATLRYRINRTRFEFAVRTGQHSSGEARVKYGTGQYAKATKKAARSATRKSSTKTKATAKKSTKKSKSRK